MKKRCTKSFNFKLFFLALFLSVGLTGYAQELGTSELKRGEVLVKFGDYLTNTLDNVSLRTDANGTLITGIARLDELNARYGATQMERVIRDGGKFEYAHRQFGAHLWYKITIDENSNLNNALTDYVALPEIQKGELNHSYRMSDIPSHPVSAPNTQSSLPGGTNDPMFSQQWHYNNTGQTGGTAGADISLLDAWQIEAGNSNVIVSVHDTGANPFHEDLSAAMWVNPGEIAGNGIDDDNNGYVDDVNGYNFYDNQGTINAGDHGSHCSGVIAGVTNNGIGISGIAGGTGSGDGARIMTLQWLTPAGSGDWGDMPSTYYYAADMGSVVSSNSIGGGSPSTLLEESMEYYIARAGHDNSAANFDLNIQTGPMAGGVIVYAAGNDNSSNAADGYPGSAYPELNITVAAIDDHDVRSSFSNYGDWIEVSAPGSDIISCYATGYGSMSGTSMACPHVSGVAALIVSKYGSAGYTPDLVWARIINTADDISAENPGYIGQLGSGRLNAHLAVLEDNGVAPANVTDLATAAPTAISLDLTWTAPADGTDPAYRYDIRMATVPITAANFSSQTQLTAPIPAAPGTAETLTVTALNPGTTYFFAMKSYDYYGNWSDMSNLAFGTTLLASQISVAPTALEVNICHAENPIATAIVTITNTGSAELAWHLESDYFPVTASTMASAVAAPTTPRTIDNPSQYNFSSVNSNATSTTHAIMSDVLWDNTNINDAGSGIVSHKLGGNPEGQQYTITADDFEVPTGKQWEIETISATGFLSGGTLDGMEVLIFADDNGQPGALEFSQTVAVADATAPVLTLTNAVVEGGKHWIALAGVFNSGTAAGSTRWNWTYGSTANGSYDAMLMNQTADFGGAIPWSNLGDLGVSGAPSMYFMIEGTEAIPVTGLDVYAADQSGTTPVGESTEVVLTFDATDVPHNADFTVPITVFSNDPYTPEVEIVAEVHVTCIAAPAIVVYPTEVTATIDVATEPLTKVKNLTIFNNGDAPLEWSLTPMTSATAGTRSNTPVVRTNNLPFIGGVPQNTGSSNITSDVLWDNTDIAVDNSIVSTYMGGRPAGTELVACADDFIVTESMKWVIDRIYTEGTLSAGSADPEAFGVVIYSDAAGMPGTEVHSEIIAVTDGITQDLLLAAPITLVQGHYWLSVYAIYNTAADLTSTRWNWAMGPTSNQNEAVLNDETGIFGIPAGWTTFSALSLTQTSTFFRIEGEEMPMLDVDWWIFEQNSPQSGTIAPGENTQVFVEFSADGVPDGTYTDSFTIYHNVWNQDNIDVPVQLTVMNQPGDMQTETTTLNFGDVFVGASRDLTFNLNNLGLGSVDYTSVSSDALYVVTPDAANIPFEGSQEVTVTFTPDAAGTFPATLTFTYTDQVNNVPFTQEIVINLNATAIMPPVIEIITDPVTENAYRIEHEMDYGQIEYRTFTIRNNGSFPLQWTTMQSAVEALLSNPEIQHNPLPDYSQNFVGTKENDISNNGPSMILGAGDDTGTGAYGYMWADTDEAVGVTYDWTDISTTGTAITGLADDNVVGSFPIGFDFPYFGENKTEFWIHSNGTIDFSAIDYDYSNSAIPTADHSGGQFIAWFWDDMDPATAATNVYYLSDGDKLVIQFDHYIEYPDSSDDYVTAQVILYNDGRVKVQYQELHPDLDIASCTVGLNFDSSTGLHVLYNEDSYLHDGLAIEMLYPGTSFGGAYDPCAVTASAVQNLLSSTPNNPLPDYSQNFAVTKENNIGGNGPGMILGAGDDSATGDYGYSWVDTDEGLGVTFDWVDITTTGTEITALPSDDGVTSSSYPIGFDFPFYGDTMTEFWLAGNGGVSFSSHALSWSDKVIPYDNYQYIAWFWDDLNAGDTSTPTSIYYQTMGNHLVIQFVDYSDYADNGGEVVNAQVILYEDGRIKLLYQSFATGFETNSSSVGINNDSSTGMQIAYHESSYFHDGLGIEILPEGIPIGGCEDPEVHLGAGLDFTPGFNPAFGLVMPGEEEIVTVEFDATNLYDGYYRYNLMVESNDPITPVEIIEIGLQVNGWPVIDVQPASLDFGDVMLHTQESMEVVVSNVGSKVMNVWTADVTTDAGTTPTPSFIENDATVSYTLQAHDAYTYPAGSRLEGQTRPASMIQSMTMATGITATGLGCDAGPIPVGIFATDADPYYDDMQTALAAFTDITVTRIDPATFATISVEDLSQYKVLIVADNLSWSGAGTSSTAAGDLLADYIDAGGKVILNEFGYDSYTAWQLSGRFVTGGYMPVSYATADILSLTSIGTIYEPTHPLMAGVTTLAEDSWHQDFTVNAGATRVVDFADGTPAVVASSNVVVINVLPNNGNACWTSDIPVVYHNAAVLLTSYEYGFATDFATPTQIEPGESTTVTVTFTPEEALDYTGMLSFTSDDAVGNTLVEVALTGTGIAPPQMTVDPSEIEVTVWASQTKDVPVTICNTGDSDLNFSFTGQIPIGVVVMGQTLNNTATPPAFIGEAPAKGADDSRVGAPVIMGAGGYAQEGYYNWIDSNEDAESAPVYEWNDIAAMGTAVPLGDDGSEEITLPFTFTFYGEAQTSIFINSNGFLSFGSGSTAYGNAVIPTTGAPNNFIAPFWRDLNPNAGGMVYHYYDGEAFVVQFTDIQEYGGGMGNTFQVKLYPNGDIMIYYNSMDTSLTCTVGLEDGTGSDKSLPIAFNTPYIENEMAIWMAPYVFRPISAYTPESGTVAPGECIEVMLTFDASSQMGGDFEGTISVWSNDPCNSETIIDYTMHVEAPQWHYETNNAADNQTIVGDCYAGITTGDEHTITIYNDSPVDGPVLEYSFTGSFPSEFESITSVRNNTAPVNFPSYEAKGGIDPTNGRGRPVIMGAGDDVDTGDQGYIWLDSNEDDGPVFEWEDITSGDSYPDFGDDTSVDVVLPFNFPFYGESKTSVKISSNGYLTFGTDGTDFSNDDIPNDVNDPQDYIAPYWDDLRTNGSGTLYTYGNANAFIITFENFETYSGGHQVTFQVKLRKSGDIVIQYLNMDDANESATIGIENADGTMGMKVAYNTNYVENNLAVLITKEVDGTSCFVWSDRFTADAEMGILQPGESATSTVTFHAEDLHAAGVYTEPIGLWTNTPASPTCVPATITVIPPEIAVTTDPDPLEVHANAGEYGYANMTINSLNNAPLIYSISGVWEAAVAATSNASAINNVEHIDYPGFAANRNEADSRVGHPVILGAGGTPETGGYMWIDSDELESSTISIPTYEWINIRETGINAPAHNDGDVSVALPFPFTFYGQTYTSVNVCANGFISFAAITGANYTHEQIPGPNNPNAIIAPMWTDLEPGGKLRTQAFYDKFIVQWTDVPHYNMNGTVSIQVILYPDGSFKMQYKDVSAAAFSASCAVGIENATGTVGEQVAFNTPYLHDGLAIMFQPYTFISAAPTHGTITDAGDQLVDLTYDATELYDGVYPTTISVWSNATENLVVVPTTLFVHGTPQIETTPTANGETLDFGIVYVATGLDLDSRLDLVISNIGTKKLVVQPLTLETGAEFTLTSSHGDAEFELMPEESTTVSLRFYPNNVVGDYTDKLYITSDDGFGNESTVIELVGKALAPPTIALSPESIGDIMPEDGMEYVFLLPVI